MRSEAFAETAFIRYAGRGKNRRNPSTTMLVSISQQNTAAGMWWGLAYLFVCVGFFFKRRSARSWRCRAHGLLWVGWMLFFATALRLLCSSWAAAATQRLRRVWEAKGYLFCFTFVFVAEIVRVGADEQKIVNLLVWFRCTGRALKFFFVIWSLVWDTSSFASQYESKVVIFWVFFFAFGLHTGINEVRK